MAQSKEKYQLNEYVTPSGKHIDVVSKNNGLLYIQFREGGQLPKEFQGGWTSQQICQNQIEAYLKRISNDGEEPESTATVFDIAPKEEEPAAPPPEEVYVGPVNGESRGEPEDKLARVMGISQTEDEQITIPPTKAEAPALGDVLEKVEGQGLVDGKPREGYKYGQGEFKGKIVKKGN